MKLRKALHAQIPDRPVAAGVGAAGHQQLKERGQNHNGRQRGQCLRDPDKINLPRRHDRIDGLTDDHRRAQRHRNL